jgi:hypothetical protein
LAIFPDQDSENPLELPYEGISELILGEAIGEEKRCVIISGLEVFHESPDELMGVEFLVVAFGEIESGDQSQSFQQQ